MKKRIIKKSWIKESGFNPKIKKILESIPDVESIAYNLSYLGKHNTSLGKSIISSELTDKSKTALNKVFNKISKKAQELGNLGMELDSLIGRIRFLNGDYDGK